MNKLGFIIIILITFRISEAQTIISGVFLSDTILTYTNSPYHVTGNVLIPIGVSVIVEPGVRFYFDTNIKLIVEGEFQAIGTFNDSIKFLLQTGSSGEWGGITYNQSAVPYDIANGTGCILDYCVLSNAGNDGAIWINTTTVFILHTDINNCAVGIIAYGSGDVIKHSRIHDCTYYAISTFYGFIFSLPVIIDSCEINNNGNNTSADIIRLTANVIFSNNCIHDNYSNYGALSIFEGPSIIVSGNNFYDNNTSAIIIIQGPDSSISILNNNFTNNEINISKSACYSFPKIIGNNFYSYINYNVYCIDVFGLGGSYCRPIPGSYYSMDMRQNYFAHSSGAQLDSSIYDLFDDAIGRTIILYDTNITSPFSSNLDCSSLFVSSHSIIYPNHNEYSFSLYPNPFKDKLNISSNENGNLELIVYDLTGRKLMQNKFTKSESINTNHLANGIYIYEGRNENGVIAVGKVVKD